MKTPSGPVRPTRRRLLAAGGTVVATGVAGCLGSPRPDVTAASSQTFDVPEGIVWVENRNGDVEVVPHAGEDVVVEILKRGRSQDSIDAVTVEGESAFGDLYVRTMNGERFRGVIVDLTIEVPTSGTVGYVAAGVGNAVVRQISGDVTVTSANGNARAINVDGYVTVLSGNGIAVARGTTGLSAARSGNGDVVAEVFALRWETDVTSGNGDVEVGVAPDLDADVLATVGNGDLDVDVELLDASVDAERASGRLGDGGPRLTLTAENGGVRLYELPG